MPANAYGMPAPQPGQLLLPTAPQSLTDLGNVVVAYMNRNDLGNAIPSFIGIAEARIAIDLRHWRMIKHLDELALGTEGWVTVPDDWLEWDRVASNGRMLGYMTRDDFWATYQAGSAQSYDYTMVGDRLIVAAPSTSAGDIAVSATYYARIPPLNDTDPPPWLLTQYPQTYIYSSLVSACEYVKDENRAQFWGAQYNATVVDLNNLSTRAAVSGSTWRQRTR